MAEVILNAQGDGRFTAHSAGSQPRGEISPAALVKLGECGHETAGLTSKSWHEFEAPEGPAFDYVITVCDEAASENCPLWIGTPVSAHWGIPDPALAEGDESAIAKAFDIAYERLARRIGTLISLPLESMTYEEIRATLEAIGQQNKNE
jgi:arsenate reductase